MDVELNNKTLYVVSAQPGAKTADLVKKQGIPMQSIITPNSVAEAAYGSSIIASGEKPMRSPRQLTGKMTTHALQGMAIMRMDEEMFTMVIDPECVSDIQRKKYADIANDMNMDVQFIIMPSSPEQAKHYANSKNLMISHVMDRYERFNRESEFPHVVYNDDIKFDFKFNELNENKLDVVGDIHGMRKELDQLLNNMGYNIENETATHPEGRKLLFMGDFVDRGYDSLGVLRLVKNTVESNNAYAILGNHEQMLLDAFDEAQENGKIKASSLSSGETIDSLLRCEPKEKHEMIDFLKDLPTYYTYEDKGKKFAFVHADVETFEPLRTPRTHLLHGDGGHRIKDSDKGYQKLFDANINQYTLIRGHAKNTSKQPNVISLEAGQAFGGHLKAMKFDQMLMLHTLKGMSPYDAAEHVSETVKCDYNYNFIKKNENELFRKMEDLYSQGLVHKLQDVEKGLTLYRATEEVYERDMFYGFPGLEKATGLVLDMGGRIIIHPSDRRGDAGDEIPYPDPSQQVVAIDDVRGFNVNVSKDPYGTGLLITTASSMDSNYTRMAKEMLEETGVYDRLNGFLARSNGTLSFAVRHPDDPRSQISEESGDKYGVTLVGGRVNSPKGYVFSEKQLDFYGSKIGAERPSWETMEFKNVVSMLVASHYSPNSEHKDNTKNKVLRKVNEDGKLDSFRFKMPSPKFLEDKLYNNLTKGKIEEIYETKGKSIYKEHYIYRLAIESILNHNPKNELIEKCDLDGIRRNKELSPEDKKTKLETAKNERQTMATQAIMYGYRKALKDRMDPYKKKISEMQEQNQREKEEKIAKIKEIQNEKKQMKRSNNSPSP